VDAIAMHKDVHSEIEVEALGDAGTGSTIAELVGLTIAGEDGRAQMAAPAGDDNWDVVGDIPTDCSAALLLVEHRWAEPLREATSRAGGFRIADGFVSPFDLAEIGLLSAQEAQRRHAQETARAQNV